MKHHKKTTVAVLRQIIGQPISSEQSLSSMTGLSVSAIKKLSAGFLPVSMKSAEAFSKATGISADWLLKQDINLPPVEIDNQTPYTRLSFDQHAGQGSSESQPYSGGVPEAIVLILSTYRSAEQSGHGSSAKNDMWSFSKLMARKYVPGDSEKHPDITALLNDAMRIFKWSKNEGALEEEVLPLTHTGELLRKMHV